MWYPIRDWGLNEAKIFLTKDFLKVPKRTKYLYVDKKPKKSIGYGFFEPILLSLCWCDFLGALYCGDGKDIRSGGIGNSKRIEIFINDILGEINPKYKIVSKDLVKCYRNGLVHAYAPSKHFSIAVLNNRNHLTKNGNTVCISVKDLLVDMIKAVKLFSKKLKVNSKSLTYGSLVALNKGRKELS